MISHDFIALNVVCARTISTMRTVRQLCASVALLAPFAKRVDSGLTHTCAERKKKRREEREENAEFKDF